MGFHGGVAFSFFGVVEAEVFVGEDDGLVDGSGDGVDVDVAVDVLGCHDVDVGGGGGPGVGVEGPLFDERTEDEVVGVVLADGGVADLVEGDAHVLDDGLEVAEDRGIERLADAGEVAALVGFGVGVGFFVLEVAEFFKGGAVDFVEGCGIIVVFFDEDIDDGDAAGGVGGEGEVVVDPLVGLVEGAEAVVVGHDEGVVFVFGAS